MIYAVEAVRRDARGDISEVRWHSIDVVQNDIVHGPSVVVPAQTAVRQVGEAAVHVFHKGAAGSELAVAETPNGAALVNHPFTPEAQLLENLETF